MSDGGLRRQNNARTFTASARSKSASVKVSKAPAFYLAESKTERRRPWRPGRLAIFVFRLIDNGPPSTQEILQSMLALLEVF